jgi:hypothetical protein
MTSSRREPSKCRCPAGANVPVRQGGLFVLSLLCVGHRIKKLKTGVLEQCLEVWSMSWQQQHHLEASRIQAETQAGSRAGMTCPLGRNTMHPELGSAASGGLRVEAP